MICLNLSVGVSFLGLEAKTERARVELLIRNEVVLVSLGTEKCVEKRDIVRPEPFALLFGDSPPEEIPMVIHIDEIRGPVNVDSENVRILWILVDGVNAWAISELVCELGLSTILGHVSG